MAQALSESHAIRDGILCIELEGPVDLNTVPWIRKRLLGPSRKREVKAIDVDLSRVTRFDTSGVAMLVEISRGVSPRNGVFRLSGLTDKARRLIQLARLDEIFEIRNDRENGI
jgi:anti-sigma B factor antagonist